jgi:hypothetical protein
MKTDDLVSLLAQHAHAVEPNAVARRYRTAVTLGAVLALVLMLATLGLRADLREAMHAPMFWIKLLFPAWLLGVAVVIAMRLSRPGVAVGRWAAALGAPLIAVWLLAAIELATASPSARPALIFGSSWRECPFNITVLSMPAFVAAFHAMRTLAPTRLALAGAAAGLVAGTLAAVVYALHCDETTAAFLGLWYVIGMAIPVAAGALLGPRLLRW